MESENDAGSRAQDGLEELKKELPVDLIVELVESRYEKRLKTRNMQWAGLIVSVTAIVVSAIVTFTDPGDPIAEAKNVIQAAQEQMNAPRPVAPAETSSSELNVGQPIVVRLSEGQRELLAIASVDGTHAILTNSLSLLGVDPVLTLYRRTPDENGDSERLENLASDDDGGEGYNARLEFDFENEERYLLEVAEFYGDAGVIELRMLEAIY